MSAARKSPAASADAPAKQSCETTPRNIERIWQKEIGGKRPFTLDSFRQIADWVYERIPEGERKRLAVRLMEYASRGTTAPPA